MHLSNNSHHRQDAKQGQLLSRVRLVWKFSFSEISCLTKAKEPSLLYYLFKGEKRRNRASLKGISTKWNTNSLIQVLNLDYQFNFLQW